MVNYLNLEQKGGHQMGKYKIKAKVEIVETDDLEVGSLKKGKDGSFEITMAIHLRRDTFLEITTWIIFLISAFCLKIVQG